MSKSLDLIGCLCNIRGNVSKTYSKFFSETIGGMKLKLGILAYEITHNKVCFFSVQLLSLLWQLKVDIALKWEKWKLAISTASLWINEFCFYRNVY